MLVGFGISISSHQCDTKYTVSDKGFVLTTIEKLVFDVASDIFLVPLLCLYLCYTRAEWWKLQFGGYVTYLHDQNGSYACNAACHNFTDWSCRSLHPVLFQFVITYILMAHLPRPIPETDSHMTFTFYVKAVLQNWAAVSLSIYHCIQPSLFVTAQIYGCAFLIHLK